jgi:Flp pilus assembly protein TadB
MSGLLAVSFGLALLAGTATAGLIAGWPRRLSAEEWVLHRRTVAAVPKVPQPAGSSWHLPGVPRYWLEKRAYQEAAKAIESDLQFGKLVGFTSLPSTPQQFRERIAKAAVTGGVLGVLVAVLAWRVGVGRSVWSTSILLAFLGIVAGASLEYLRVHRTAGRLRRAVIRRLPRVITGARMVMESGAATPEGALAMAVSLYADPASDVLREALRIKEVQKLSVEDALDQVGRRYGLDPLGQLADAFRIGRRYGTRMSDILASFANELRREWHVAYRERITRAPVLMTIPALIFFVAPLLFLILFLVFSPLFSVLGQL